MRLLEKGSRSFFSGWSTGNRSRDSIAVFFSVWWTRNARPRAIPSHRFFLPFHQTENKSFRRIFFSSCWNGNFNPVKFTYTRFSFFPFDQPEKNEREPFSSSLILSRSRETSHPSMIPQTSVALWKFRNKDCLFQGWNYDVRLSQED